MKDRSDEGHHAMKTSSAHQSHCPKISAIDAGMTMVEKLREALYDEPTAEVYVNIGQKHEKGRNDAHDGVLHEPPFWIGHNVRWK